MECRRFTFCIIDIEDKFSRENSFLHRFVGYSALGFFVDTLEKVGGENAGRRVGASSYLHLLLLEFFLFLEFEVLSFGVLEEELNVIVVEDVALGQRVIEVFFKFLSTLLDRFGVFIRDAEYLS